MNEKDLALSRLHVRVAQLEEQNRSYLAHLDTLTALLQNLIKVLDRTDGSYWPELMEVNKWLTEFREVLAKEYSGQDQK